MQFVLGGLSVLIAACAGPGPAVSGPAGQVTPAASVAPATQAGAPASAAPGASPATAAPSNLTIEISGPISVKDSVRGTCSTGDGAEAGTVDVQVNGSTPDWSVQLDINRASPPAANQPISIADLGGGMYDPAVQIVDLSGGSLGYVVSRGTVTLTDPGGGGGIVNATALFDNQAGAQVAGTLTMTWHDCSLE